MTSIVRQHYTDPTTCAALLVDAARSAGSRDDATALVLTHHPQPPTP